MRPEDAAAVIAIARSEIAEERFRTRVEREKERLRKKVSLWHRLFPFVITITRRPR